MSDTKRPHLTESERAIEARVEAATPGPWVEGSGHHDPDSYGLLKVCSAARFLPVAECEEVADAAMIAAAPTDLAALLDEVSRLRTEVGVLTTLVAEIPSHISGMDSHENGVCHFCRVDEEFAENEDGDWTGERYEHRPDCLAVRAVPRG